MKFQYKYSLEQRMEESKRIISRYSDRIPIICEKSNNVKDLPEIDKIKYLVPKDLNMGQFLFVIRKQLKLNKNKTLYLCINNVIPVTTGLVIEMYERFKDEDGFLYVTYSIENTFG